MPKPPNLLHKLTLLTAQGLTYHLTAAPQISTQSGTDLHIESNYLPNFGKPVVLVGDKLMMNEVLIDKFSTNVCRYTSYGRTNKRNRDIVSVDCLRRTLVEQGWSWQ